MPDWSIDRVRNINESDLNTLLYVLRKYNGRPYPSNIVNIVQDLIDANYLLHPITDSQNGDRTQIYKKKWMSYCGPINAYGLGLYGENFTLSPVAQAYLNKELTYQELMTDQMKKWQIPNSSIKINELRTLLNNGVRVKPFAILLKTLLLLSDVSEQEAWIDKYDVVTHLEPLTCSTDLEEIIPNIINDREIGVDRQVNSSSDIDILLNAFCATGLLIKLNEAVVSICRLQKKLRGVYKISPQKRDVIEIVISESESKYFEIDLENKDDWFSYYGSFEEQEEKNDQDTPLEEKKVDDEIMEDMNVKIYRVGETTIFENGFLNDNFDKLQGITQGDLLFLIEEGQTVPEDEKQWIYKIKAKEVNEVDNTTNRVRVEKHIFCSNITKEFMEELVISNERG